MGVGRLVGGSSHGNIQSSLTSCQEAAPAQPPLLGQGQGSAGESPGLFSGLRMGRENSPHVGRAGGREASYIILLELPVLLLGQDLVHHSHGLLPLVDVLPLLVREGRRRGQPGAGTPLCSRLVLSLDTHTSHGSLTQPDTGCAPVSQALGGSGARSCGSGRSPRGPGHEADQWA